MYLCNIDILKRKVFTVVLGQNFVPNDQQTKELTLFLESKYGKINNSYLRIRYFVLYDLSNYVGRYEQSIKDGKSVTLLSLQNKYGEVDGLKKYNEYIEKQRYANTVEYFKENMAMPGK